MVDPATGRAVHAQSPLLPSEDEARGISLAVDERGTVLVAVQDGVLA